MEAKSFYDFKNFRLDLEERVLLHDGKPISITPKVFDLLKVLIENRGRVIEKDELMAEIWKDSFVEDSNLAFNIRQLRKALDDDARQPTFIETVPKRGYRFIAEVREIVSETESNNGSAQMVSQPVENSSANSLKLKKMLLPAAAILIVGVVITVFWYTRSKTGEINAPILSAPFASEKLSTNGKVVHAVISPDGKNVVYTNGIESKQSVWLRQLESGDNVELIPPSDDVYAGLALSPDGKFLYFSRGPNFTDGQFDIYRVPIFGGVPQKIVIEAQGWIALAPDGGKISFVRCYYREDEHCSLWIADAADGKNERKLVARPRPFRIADNDFSPDGKTIVFAVGQSRNAANEFGLSEIDIESGEESELIAQKFFNIKNLVWLPDKSGLLMTAARVPNKHFRIWQVSLASREATPLTKDSETYSNLSLNEDANILVSTHIKQNFRLYLLNTENPSAKPNILADASMAVFAPNGKIVFSSVMSGNDEIWSINADGSERRQLTNNTADEGAPVVSTDSSSVFFTSNRTGEAHVWRMNADGSNQVQITQKTGGFPHSVSLDGKWLYYFSGLQKALWRISTEGGEEHLVRENIIYRFAVSPDGSQIALQEKQGEENILMIVSLADGQTIKTFKFADESPKLIDLKWSWDGEYLACILADNEYKNNTLWFQPLNGKSPRKIVDFGDEEISETSGLALTPDGKTFAFVQGGWLHDAVLLKGLK